MATTIAQLDHRLSSLEEEMKALPDEIIRKLNGSYKTIQTKVEELQLEKRDKENYDLGFAAARKPNWFLKELLPVVVGTVLGVWVGAEFHPPLPESAAAAVLYPGVR